MKKKIVIFSGAGLDRESGILTFRDCKDGLWNNYNIEEVATPEGWRKNREKVLSFYNERRQEMAKVEPNLAHKLIASLEADYDVTNITQNVTNLLERGGSTKVIHLHGELIKARGCMYNGLYSLEDNTILLGYDDIKIGDKCPVSQSQLRPHIVWFGEMPFGVDRAYQAMRNADYLLVIGTSLNITYTLDMLGEIGEDCKVVYIDPEPTIGLEKYVKKDVTILRYGGAEGMAKLIEKLKNKEI